MLLLPVCCQCPFAGHYALCCAGCSRFQLHLMAFLSLLLFTHHCCCCPACYFPHSCCILVLFRLHSAQHPTASHSALHQERVISLAGRMAPTAAAFLSHGRLKQQATASLVLLPMMTQQC
jgi:hypothetical protein